MTDNREAHSTLQIKLRQHKTFSIWDIVDASNGGIIASDVESFYMHHIIKCVNSHQDFVDTLKAFSVYLTPKTNTIGGVRNAECILAELINEVLKKSGEL